MKHVLWCALLFLFAGFFNLAQGKLFQFSEQGNEFSQFELSQNSTLWSMAEQMTGNPLNFRLFLNAATHRHFLPESYTKLPVGTKVLVPNSLLRTRTGKQNSSVNPPIRAGLTGVTTAVPSEPPTDERSAPTAQRTRPESSETPVKYTDRFDFMNLARSDWSLGLLILSAIAGVLYFIVGRRIHRIERGLAKPGTLDEQLSNTYYRIDNTLTACQENIELLCGRALRHAIHLLRV